MQTQTLERQELQQVIDTLPDEGVKATLDFIKHFRQNAGLLDADDGFYNPANLRRLDHSIEQLKQGKIVVKTLEELEKMADE